MNRLKLYFMIIIFAGFLPAKSQELVFTYKVALRPQSECLIIEDTLENIWEIGMPSKSFFDSSYYGNLAIVTDSVEYYSDSCNDFFLINLSPVYGAPQTLLTFNHKYDTDTLTDGGIIEISYDIGDTWINIHDDISEEGNYWPSYTNHLGISKDTLLGGEYGYSGRSGGWKQVQLDWLWYLPVKSSTNYTDTVLIRFRFISDGINNSKEGWMIDNIELTAYTFWDIETFQSSSITIAPTPASDYINVYSNDPDLARYNIKIFDPSGRLRLSKQLGNSQINIEELETGNYFYQIGNKVSLIKTGKLIIK